MYDRLQEVGLFVYSGALVDAHKHKRKDTLAMHHLSKLDNSTFYSMMAPVKDRKLRLLDRSSRMLFIVVDEGTWRLRLVVRLDRKSRELREVVWARTSEGNWPEPVPTGPKVR